MIYVSHKLEPICQFMWENKFKDVEFDWEYIWVKHCFAVKEPRVCSLMWKIIHNVYPTAIWLSKMGIKDSAYCSHCS